MLTRILNSIYNNNKNTQFNQLRNIYLTHYKLCKTNSSKVQEKSSLEEFTPIYKFPYIRSLSILTRMKLYQTILTTLGIPGSVVLNQMNLIHTDGVWFTCALGFSGCAVLYTLSYLSQNFIGFIYLSDNEKQVKLSYLDFWGKRRDEIIDKEDIIPLTDLPVAFTDGMFFKVKRFSNNNSYKLNTRFGIVLDINKFNYVFK